MAIVPNGSGVPISPVTPLFDPHNATTNELEREALEAEIAAGAFGALLQDTATRSAAMTLLAITQGDVSGLVAALAGKAATAHTHVVADITDITAAGQALLDDANTAAQRTTLGLGALATLSTITASLISDPTNVKSIESLIIAVGDESTAITTGTAKVTFRMPYAFTLAAVRASLTTASSSGIPTVDINEGGASILSTKLTIDATQKTSTTATTAAVISDTSLADDAEISIDIDVAGTDAAGLKVYLIGRRT